MTTVQNVIKPVIRSSIHGFFVILCALLLTSCPAGFLSLNDPFVTGKNVFPPAPVNLGEINSSFDDYNSAYPSTLGETFPLYFSSNRRNGTDFDIVVKALDIKMERSNGILIVAEKPETRFGTWRGGQDLAFALELVNTPTADELGPYIITQGSPVFGTTGQQYDGYILLFARHAGGQADIYYTHNLGTNFIAPRPLRFANSSADDAYPALTHDSSALYFCSNRAGTFDLYSVGLQGLSTLAKLENTTTLGVRKDTVLSSAADDKCPFIWGKILVFSSNRPGGKGGFDLYYAVLEANGQWSPPKNFGEPVNTPFDEYRPILKGVYGFNNLCMIFSSDRPGGKGGFDLYYVGVSDIARK